MLLPWMGKLIPEDFKWRNFPYYLTVEPIAFLLYSGAYIYIIVLPSALKDRIEYTYTPEADVKWNADEYANEMQRMQVSWGQYAFAANLIPCLAMVTYLGAWSDRNGRQVNCLIGITALSVGIVARTTIFSWSVLAPIWVWPVLSLVEGAMGNYGTTYYAGQAYQADIVPNKDDLTWRMNMVSLSRALGAVIGSYLAGWVPEMVDFCWTVCIASLLLILPYAWALLWVPQIPPKLLDRARNQVAIEMAGDRDRVVTVLSTGRDRRATSMRRGATVKSSQLAPPSMPIWKEILMDYKDAYKTFVRPREGWNRACIWVLTVIGFVSTLSGAEAGGITGPYCMYILKWTNKQYADWNIENIVVTVVGQIIGIFIMKKVLKMRDTWVLQIAMLSFGLSQIPIAFATDWGMRLSNYVQFLANIQSPVLSSIMTTFVEPHEVGKVFVAFTFTTYLSLLVQQFVLQEIYKWSLDWLPGFMFYLVAFLLFVCNLLTIFIQVFEKPPKVFDVEDIVNKEIEEEEQIMERRASRAVSIRGSRLVGEEEEDGVDLHPGTDKY